jgi:hypothetical protein
MVYTLTGDPVFPLQYDKPLKLELRALLGDGEYIKVEKHKTNSFEIKYGRMYNSPGINFATLKKLSDMFGTDKIDVDNYSSGGCDTCDWGSDYGHTIQIYEPTKRVEELAALHDMDLMEND